jgi:hypothetical protein
MKEPIMKIPVIALVLVAASNPSLVVAGRDGADEMIKERARQHVIEQRARMRAFQACIAAAKTDAQTNQCRERLEPRS